MPKIVGNQLPRPTDEALIKRVADATELGHPIDTAGILSGLGHDTARQWLTRGIAQMEAGDEQGSHVAFAVAIQTAQAAMVDVQLHHIARDAANKGGWTAAMTLLERRRPNDFGRNQQIQIESRTVALNVNVSLPALTEQRVLSLIKDSLDSGIKLLPPPSKQD